MQELVDKLKNEAGLSDEQAQKSAEIVKSFVLAKVPPMFAAVVEGFFAGGAVRGAGEVDILG